MLYGADHVFEAGAGRIPQFAQRLLRGDVQGYLVYEIVRIVAFAHAVAVANNDVDGIVEKDGDRISPKITTIIFDVDDTLYDVSTVSR